MRLSFVLFLFLAAGCAPTEPSSMVNVPVVVMSGREQPAPSRTAVDAGAEVVVQLEGLGPPRAAVFDPSGARVSVAEAPLSRDGHVVGTGARFVAHAAGTYRVEQVEAEGQPLAFVDVR